MWSRCFGPGTVLGRTTVLLLDNASGRPQGQRVDILFLAELAMACVVNVIAGISAIVPDELVTVAQQSLKLWVWSWVWAQQTGMTAERVRQTRSVFYTLSLPWLHASMRKGCMPRVSPQGVSRYGVQIPFMHACFWRKFFSLHIPACWEARVRERGQPWYNAYGAERVNCFAQGPETGSLTVLVLELPAFWSATQSFFFFTTEPNFINPSTYLLLKASHVSCESSRELRDMPFYLSHWMILFPMSRASSCKRHKLMIGWTICSLCITVIRAFTQSPGSRLVYHSAVLGTGSTPSL